MTTVRDLKKCNRNAVNNIKNYPYPKNGNLFFEGLFISALIADPLRMCIGGAV